jgi:hypothetical protein
MTNYTNTNSARKFRATLALVFIFIATAISAFIISDAIRYGENISAYYGGFALWEAVGALAVAFVLLAWNVVTYNRPRYARSRG